MDKVRNISWDVVIYDETSSDLGCIPNIMFRKIFKYFIRKYLVQYFECSLKIKILFRFQLNI